MLEFFDPENGWCVVFRWTVEPGEIVTLIGPNGSGKSTTAKLALGVLAADEGFGKPQGTAPGQLCAAEAQAKSEPAFVSDPVPSSNEQGG